MTISEIAKACLYIGLLYCAAWTISFMFFVGLDFQYYFEYLALAWTGPGEIPAFIQWGALTITLMTIVSVVVIRRLIFHARREGAR